VNPFGEHALGSPWKDTPVDVPSINDAPFRAILQALSQMRMGGRGTSMVMTGEPGSGKTHLLSRLRKSIAADVAYIYVRCNASAATLWRHVRASVASDLLKREGGNPSRLQSVLWRNPERIEEVRNLSLQRVLNSYGEGRHVLAASAWLRGEALPQSDLDALGIGAERDDEERSRETEAKDAVNGLLSFLAPDPVLLCFDQVEALETYRGDRDGFHVMGTMVAELCHEHSHLLLVSCIVSAFEVAIDELTNKANRDRWQQHKFSLRPIDWSEAVKLIKARLDASSELVPLRQRHSTDPLWPLDAQSITPLFEATGLCLPRTLIQACRIQFEGLLGDQSTPRPKLSRQDFLQQEYAETLKEARLVVERQGGDKTLGEALPWLIQSSGLTPLGRDDQRARYSNLAFRTARTDIAIALCYCGGVELFNRLRKIHRLWTNDPPGLRVICDASVKPGARSQELLETIKRRGAQVVYPLPEAIAALQAIHDMIAFARSGDFNQDGDGVNESEVTKWALDNMPPQLEQLRDELMGGAKTENGDPVLPKLAALLRERKVIEAGIAARELELTPEEISACARRNPMQFGVLAGPPLVLFQAIEGPGSQPEGPLA
jgi:hypothetical protein